MGLSDQEPMIEITVRDYESLKSDHDFLMCLQAVGVDNWEGYTDAQEMMEE